MSSLELPRADVDGKDFHSHVSCVLLQSSNTNSPPSWGVVMTTTQLAWSTRIFGMGEAVANMAVV
jgi:hypothetical protein